MSVGDGLTLRSAQGLDLDRVQCLWMTVRFAILKIEPS